MGGKSSKKATSAVLLPSIHNDRPHQHHASSNGSHKMTRPSRIDGAYGCPIVTYNTDILRAHMIDALHHDHHDSYQSVLPYV